MGAATAVPSQTHRCGERCEDAERGRTGTNAGGRLRRGKCEGKVIGNGHWEWSNGKMGGEVQNGRWGMGAFKHAGGAGGRTADGELQRTSEKESQGGGGNQHDARDQCETVDEARGQKGSRGRKIIGQQVNTVGEAVTLQLDEPKW
ncbi:hypothetical protein HNY73_002164 [Argiope bruennichi]|uniref:Uncharacterized protein n=1 Tax=Argiope bruennichi TaxID=94029 RepID=A0A8T0FSM7_ARGBR|nr:hypothetical protein HNY73_002164 [Argiope bruennichi]